MIDVFARPRRVLYAPMTIAIVWLAVTMVVFTFGPFAPLTENMRDTFSFMTIVIVVVSIGYSLGVASAKRRQHRNVVVHPRPRSTGMESAATPERRAPNLLVAIAAIWYIAYSLMLLSALGVNSPASLFQAIANPRESYFAKFSSLGGVQVSAYNQLLNAAGIFYFLLIPYLLANIRRLSKLVVLLGLTGLVLYVCAYLAAGTQRGVGDVAVFSIVSGLGIWVIARGNHAPRARRRRAAVILVPILIIAALVTIVWSLGMRTDSTSSFITYESSQEQLTQLTPIFGEVGARGLVLLSGYLSQGYYGLSLALQLPWNPDGIGSGAPALWSLAVQYLGAADPSAYSYPARVEANFGWSSTVHWSTVFPWLASDLTFVGAVIMSGLVAFLLARVWISYLSDGHAWSLVWLNVIAVAVIYAPANNQLFNDRFAAYGVVLLCLLSLFIRRRYTRADAQHGLSSGGWDKTSPGTGRSNYAHPGRET